MKQFRIPESCSFCAAPFYDGNFSNVIARSFDHLESNSNAYPVLMDFSLENTCNLACIMCDASLSSTIQKARMVEHSKEKYIYDDEFIKQLDEFIPYLKHAVFTGGEPFLINAYYRIWNRFIEINPEIIINITTNGTVFNERIESLLKKGRFNITVSIDSLVPETYSAIRKGADLNITMQNIHRFAEICEIRGTVFTITVCPMIINMRDIPQIVETCNLQGWYFNFNTVLKPWKQALWSLDDSSLSELIACYKSIEFTQTNTDQANKNISFFTSLIALLENWQVRMRERIRTLVSPQEISALRMQIIELLRKKLTVGLSENDHKITQVAMGIPDVLVNPRFLNYLNSMSDKMIINEFRENDAETISDHFCIIAFNL